MCTTETHAHTHSEHTANCSAQCYEVAGFLIIILINAYVWCLGAAMALWEIRPLKCKAINS